MANKTKRHLIHGGHKGTESVFGRVAESHGISETTISFDGHAMERAVNVEVLDEEAMSKGRVSMEFVFERMGRRFVRGHGLRGVMKSMFTIVVRSSELFAIGWIQDDGTIKGGTGWGVELAKVFNRPVHVFDQDKNSWFDWDGRDWQASEPTLPEGTFGATGTRNLTEHGATAIEELFTRSLS